MLITNERAGKVAIRAEVMSSVRKNVKKRENQSPAWRGGPGRKMSGGGKGAVQPNS